MSLPSLPAGDKFRREVRTEWGGLNLNENAGDGELCEALNMSSREFPLLTNERFAKETAQRIGDTANIYAPFSYNGRLGYIEKLVVQGQPTTYHLHDPFYTTQSPQVKITSDFAWYAIMGHRLIIFPSKQVYDFETHSMTDMEQTASLTALGFTSVNVDGVPGEANCIYDPNMSPGSAWPFNAGDAVTIAGCTDYPENNKTIIIRKILDANLYFDDYALQLARKWTYDVAVDESAGTFGLLLGDPNDTPRRYARFTATSTITDGSTITYIEPENTVTIQPSGGTAYTYAAEIVDSTAGMTDILVSKSMEEVPYTESGTITISRTVPDMDFICVNENRLWGCKGDTIYASKLGDPLNFNVFDGLSTDSYSVETGTQGEFTGCCSFQGYPTFFKEGAVFKVLGDEPSNFVLRKQNIVGVRRGGGKTIVEIRGKLYYSSWDGVMEWNGGDYPQIVSAALGMAPDSTYFYSAGSDTVRYYAAGYAYDYNREYGVTTPVGGVYVYDPRFGTWHLIKAPDYPDVEFTFDGVTGYMLKNYSVAHKPDVFILTGHKSSDSTVEWRVTFADSTRAYKTALTGSESKKGVLRLLIRCRLAKTMKVWISYDGGDFEEAGEFGGEDGMEKTSRVVPLILRRCDYWQLRLTGVGDAVIYSIAVEKYGGEWQQA